MSFFRARRIFTWGALSVVLGAALAYSFVLAANAVGKAELDAERRAEGYANSVLYKALTPSMVGQPIDGQDYGDVLVQVQAGILKDDAVLRVRVWNSAGVLVFSSDQRDQLGHQAPSGLALEKALGGTTVNEVTAARVAQQPGLAGSDEKLLVSYVPLRLGGQSAPAVVEIDQRYSSILASVYELWRPLQVGLGVVVLFALAMLVASIRSRAVPSGSALSGDPRAAARARSLERQVRELEQRATEADDRAKQADERVKTAEERADALTKDKTALEQELETSERNPRISQGDLTGVEARAAEAERRLAEADARAVEAEQRLAESDRRVAEIEQRSSSSLEQAQGDLDRISTRLSETQTALADSTEELTKLQTELQRAQQDRADAVAELQRAGLATDERDQELERLRTAITERDHQIQDLQREILERSAELEQTRTGMGERSGEIEQVRTEAVAAVAELEQLRTEAVAKNAELDALRTEAVARASELEEVTAEVQRAHEQLASAQLELRQARERVQDLEERAGTTAAAGIEAGVPSPPVGNGAHGVSPGEDVPSPDSSEFEPPDEATVGSRLSALRKRRHSPRIEEAPVPDEHREPPVVAEPHDTSEEHAGEPSTPEIGPEGTTLRERLTRAAAARHRVPSPSDGEER